MSTDRPLFLPRTDIPRYSHQEEQDPQIHGQPYAARFWRTGTGKTRSDIEDSLWLYCSGQIDSVIVVAPNEVHRRTWISNEIPKWLQLPDYKALAYISKSGATKAEYRELEALVEHPGLRILAIYFEALASKSGQEFVKRFVQRGGRIKVTVDESHRIMSPGSVASSFLRKSVRDKTAFRRIMTATPTGNGIQDLYAQYAFLSPDILQCSTFAEFKAMFVHEITIPGTHIKKVTGYRNVKWLNKRIAPYTYVAKKPEGLPPQVYVDVPVEMSDEQWKHYREMKEAYQTELRTGHWVQAELAIVRLRRLQQIVEGFLPVPDEGDETKDREVVPLVCPRLDTLLDRIKGAPGKVIVWATEHPVIERIHKTIQEAGIGSVMYYGKISKGEARDHNLDQFENDLDTKVLVANDAVGGTGLTIVGKAAPVGDVVFYSHTWSRLLREQSEGRNHRAGNTAEHCIYHDLLAYGTTDIRIRARVKMKDDIARMVEDPREIAKLLDDDIDYVIDNVTLPNV